MLEHEPGVPFAWTFQTAELNLPSGAHDRAVQAWDSAGEIQPALPDDVWNYQGQLCTCWHRLRVRLG